MYHVFLKKMFSGTIIILRQQHGHFKLFKFEVGCWWHGHDPTECTLNARVSSNEELSLLQKRHQRTVQRRQFIEKCGFAVNSIWECEFLESIENTAEMENIKSKLLPRFYMSHPREVTSEIIIDSVVSGDLFGAVEVDISIPEKWSEHFKQDVGPQEYFSEMSPLFCTVNIPFDIIGEHMQEHVRKHNLSQEPRRLLVGGTKARRILLASPLLKWYLEHGLVVSHVYQVLEFSPNQCFKSFQEQVTEARRRGDCNPDMSIISESMKLVGNAAFGSVLMEKTRHQSIKIAQNENQLLLKVNDPLFKQMTQLSENCYEVVLGKKCITLDLPIQVGFFVLQYAKQHMLSFYYDFMMKYVERPRFQYIEMDTDSAYMALSEKTLYDSIKPNMKHNFMQSIQSNCHDKKYEPDNNSVWFPRICCNAHSKYDSRTPGLFKEEATGDEMVALSSKCYLLSSGDRCKVSCKGVNKCTLENPLAIFKDVLETKQPVSNTNRGIRVRNNTVFSYEQQKNGFSYYYCKRQLLPDGVSTIPLDIVLSPIDDGNMFIFDLTSVFSPSHHFVFAFAGQNFTSIYQCYIYQKAHFICLPTICQKILDTSSFLEHKLIDSELSPSNAWYFLGDQTLENICAEKMKLCYEIRVQLSQVKNCDMYFADEEDKWMGVGLKQSLIRLVNPDSFPGRNILGQTWKKVAQL